MLCRLLLGSLLILRWRWLLGNLNCRLLNLVLHLNRLGHECSCRRHVWHRRHRGHLLRLLHGRLLRGRLSCCRHHRSGLSCRYRSDLHRRKRRWAFNSWLHCLLILLQGLLCNDRLICHWLRRRRRLLLFG